MFYCDGTKTNTRRGTFGSSAPHPRQSIPNWVISENSGILSENHDEAEQTFLRNISNLSIKTKSAKEKGTHKTKSFDDIPTVSQKRPTIIKTSERGDHSFKSRHRPSVRFAIEPQFQKNVAVLQIFDRSSGKMVGFANVNVNQLEGNTD